MVRRAWGGASYVSSFHKATLGATDEAVQINSTSYFLEHCPVNCRAAYGNTISALPCGAKPSLQAATKLYLR